MHFFDLLSDWFYKSLWLGIGMPYNWSIVVKQKRCFISPNLIRSDFYKKRNFLKWIHNRLIQDSPLRVQGWKRKKLVIQGSHMVSGTRCPAGSDPVKKWSESRAAAPKGQCPVEHRGNFHTSRGGIFLAIDDWFRPKKAYLKAGGQNWGLESGFEVWRANLSHRGLIWCLEGWLRECLNFFSL